MEDNMNKAEKIVSDLMENIREFDNVEEAVVFTLSFMCGVKAADSALAEEVYELMKAEVDFNEGFEII